MWFKKSFRLRLFTSAMLLVYSEFIYAGETLYQAWEIAVKNNELLKASQTKVDTEVYKLKQIKSMAMPSLNIRSGVTELSEEPSFLFQLAPGQTASVPMKEEKYPFTTATISVPLFSSGQFRYGKKAQKFMIEAEESSYQSAVLNLKKEVTESYVTVLKLSEKVEAANIYVDTLKSHRKIVESLHGQGMALKNDLLASDAALAQGRLQKKRLESALKLAGHNFNRLLGRSLDSPLSLEPIENIEINLSFEELLESALKNNKDLVAINSRRDALLSTVKAYKAKNLPVVALVGAYSFEENQYQANDEISSLSVVLDWTLDFGVNRHQANQFSSQLNQLTHVRTDVYRQLRLGLIAELERHKLNEEATDAMNLALKQADEYKRNIGEMYKSGLATQAEVLTAHTLYLNSQADYFDAKYEMILSAISILHITGSFASLEVSVETN